jgi:hypothetical protein
MINANWYNQARKSAQNVIVRRYVREQIPDSEVIFVYVSRRTSPILGNHSFHNPHEVLLEGWPANAAENGPGMALAILGRHQTDSGNQLFNTTRQETIQFVVLGGTYHLPTFPYGHTELYSCRQNRHSPDRKPLGTLSGEE